MLPAAFRLARRTFASDAVARAPDRQCRLLLFGKPGAGKGTMSARLEKLDVKILSAGDILRQNVAQGTELGKMADKTIKAGGLLPDDIMLKLLTGALRPLQSLHWILDGFPRTLGQGELLDQALGPEKTLNLVVNIDVPDEIILDRIKKRWIHPASGRVYNLDWNPPKVSGLDDVTGQPLIQRADDNPETFARRLQTYQSHTAPLLSYYASPLAGHAAPRLVTLTGATSDEIWPQLERVVMDRFDLRDSPVLAQEGREADERRAEVAGSH